MPGAREEIYTIDSTMYYDYFYLYNLEIIPNSLIIILNLYIVPIELQNPFFIGLPHAYFCIAILCSHFSFYRVGNATTLRHRWTTARKKTLFCLGRRVALVSKAWCSSPSHIITRTSCSILAFFSNLCVILGLDRLG